MMIQRLTFVSKFVIFAFPDYLSPTYVYELKWFLPQWLDFDMQKVLVSGIRYIFKSRQLCQFQYQTSTNSKSVIPGSNAQNFILLLQTFIWRIKVAFLELKSSYHYFLSGIYHVSLAVPQKERCLHQKLHMWLKNLQIWVALKFLLVIQLELVLQVILSLLWFHPSPFCTFGLLEESASFCSFCKILACASKLHFLS